MRIRLLIATLSLVGVQTSCADRPTRPEPPREANPLATPGPELPRGDLNCSRDEDCAFYPEGGCGCSPCGEVWRRPTNAKYAEWLRGQYAIESCRLKECKPCAVPLRWLGTEVRCVGGLCVVR